MSSEVGSLTWPQRFLNWRNAVYAVSVLLVAYAVTLIEPTPVWGSVLFAGSLGLMAALMGPSLLPFHDSWKPRLILLGCMVPLTFAVALAIRTMV